MLKLLMTEVRVFILIINCLKIICVLVISHMSLLSIHCECTRDAPIICISGLVRWYRPIVVYTVGR